MSNRKAKQRQSKPWVNNSILKEIKKRDKIYKKLKKNTDFSKQESLKTKLRIQKNKVKEVLRSAKKLYFTDYFTKHNSNAKKVWEGINLIIHTKSKKKQSINCLEIKKQWRKQNNHKP